VVVNRDACEVLELWLWGSESSSVRRTRAVAVG
jgi:hypothetical protein